MQCGNVLLLTIALGCAKFITLTQCSLIILCKFSFLTFSLKIYYLPIITLKHAKIQI
jgi:hypothetical protein